MQKTEPGLFFDSHLRRISSYFLQQRKGAIDVGTNKIVGTMDRPIHVTLGSKVNNGGGAMPLQQIVHKLPVTDIPVDEAIAWVGGNLFEIAKIPRICELVQIDERSALFRNPLQNEVGADESSPSGHQNGLRFRHKRLTQPLSRVV